MSSATQKQPGPDHPITIQPSLDRVQVKLGGQIVADSSNALTLREASYPPVQYIPRSDVRMDLLVATAHHTHCPYKGEASYFSIKAGDRSAENAVWSYEHPYPAVQEIAGHLAFYPERVDSIDVTKAASA